jgi:hypothetical protein
MHPLQKIPQNRTRAIFFYLLVITLMIMAIMNTVGKPLETQAAPNGIISYELAGSAAEAQFILDSWDDFARQHAAFSLGLDYLFMLFYSTTIALGCVWAGRVLKARGVSLAIVGVPLAWGLWAAAVFDAVENMGLTLILFGADGQYWAPVARWCAILKFGLIFLGIIYSFVGLAISLVLKPKE